MTTRSPVPLIALLSGAFIAIGGSVAILGPSLPGLATGIGRPLPDIGALLSALFAGVLVGQGTAGVLVDRYGVRPTLLVSLVIFSGGVIAIPVASTLAALLTSGLVMGLGFGSSSIAINSLAATLVPHRPGFVINVCNVWYAVGSVTGPLLASVVLGRGGQGADLLAGAGVLLLLLVPVAWRLVPATLSAAPPPRSPRRAQVAPDRWRPSPALLLMGVAVLLYAGVEAGFGGWMASYVQATLGVSGARGALLTSLFWFAFLVGRLVATAATLRLAPGRVLAATAAVITLGGLVLGVGHARYVPTVVAIGLLGAGVGPVYPTMFALVTSRFTARPATAVAVTSSIGSLGAIVLPWVMGRALPVADGQVVAWMPCLFGSGMLLALWSSQVLYRRGR